MKTVFYCNWATSWLMGMCTNVMKFRPDPCHVYLAPVVAPVKLSLSQCKHNTATTPTHTSADKRQQFSCDRHHDQHSLLHRLLQERLQLRVRAGAAGGRGGGPGAADHPRPPAPGCGPWHHRQTCQPCLTIIGMKSTILRDDDEESVYLRFHTGV